MSHNLAYLRRRLDTSIWAIPALFCLASLVIGLLMVWLDRHVTNLFDGWQMFAMSVDSARQVLSVIAGAVISVGGVSFSITMVALTLTSGQYGPKVLRHFLEDNTSKISLGLFLGTFVYTLVVLTGYVKTDQPHLSVLTALLMALLAIVGFVHFIHRIATDLQADEIVQRIGARLREGLRGLTETSSRQRRSCGTQQWRRQARGHRGFLVAASGQGYVQTVDYDGLAAWSRSHDCCLQVRVRAGDFIIKGTCVFKVYGCASETLERELDRLNARIVTGPVRTAAQDPEFPITQLSQIAARALSPGINDPGTAISCVDSFCLALAEIVDRDLPGNQFLDDEGEARLLARTLDFGGLLKAVFAPLRQFARTNVSVTIGLYESLCRLAELTTRADRLSLLALHGRLISEEIEDISLADNDKRDIVQRAKKLQILAERRL
jgi:uncharacterized membrane protein